MIEIPVSCLEEARWGRERPFAGGRSYAPLSVRYAKNASVSRSVESAGVRASAQGRVWERVSSSLRRAAVASPTGAMSAADEVLERDVDRRAAVEALVERGPLPGQTGVAVAHGGRVVAIEGFGSPALLARHWRALVRSYLLEPPAGGGEPDAGRVLAELKPNSRAPCRVTRGLGAGDELHLRRGPTTGQALVLDGAVMHFSLMRPFDDRGSAADTLSAWR